MQTKIRRLPDEHYKIKRTIVERPSNLNRLICFVLMSGVVLSLGGCTHVRTERESTNSSRAHGVPSIFDPAIFGFDQQGRTLHGMITNLESKATDQLGRHEETLTSFNQRLSELEEDESRNYRRMSELERELKDLQIRARLDAAERNLEVITRMLEESVNK